MKKKMLAGAIVLSILLTACGNPADTQETGDSQNPGSEKVENVLPPETEDSESETTTEPDSTEDKPEIDFVPSGNEMLDLDNYSLRNEQAEDVMPRTSWSFMAKGNGGYYYGMQTLRFFDPQSKMIMTVCNKPNCKHQDSSCAAYLMADNSSTDTMMDSFYMMYYDGYVYCTGQNRKEEYAYLSRIAGDGSTKGDFMPLYRYDTSANDFVYPHFVIAEDTLYYVDNSEEQQSLRKCKLGESKQTVAFATERDGGMVYRMKVCGDYLFFQTYIRSEEGEKQGGIYAYNLKTNKAIPILKDVIATYAVVGEKLIYNYDDDIYSYDLRTAENVKLLTDKAETQFICNSRYIVTGNLEVYTMAGEYVCKLALEEFDDIYGMDEDYILANVSVRISDTQIESRLGIKPISELDDKPFEKYKCED